MKTKVFKIENGKIPSEMYRELSGRNERNGIILGSKTIGRRLSTTAKKGIIDSPKIGGVYIHDKVGRTRASLRGAFPANQSGELVRSIGFKLRNRSSFAFGSTADYAPDLMTFLQRPFLTLSNDKSEKHFEKDMANSMMRIIGK